MFTTSTSPRISCNCCAVSGSANWLNPPSGTTQPSVVRGPPSARPEVPRGCQVYFGVTSGSPTATDQPTKPRTQPSDCQYRIKSPSRTWFTSSYDQNTPKNLRAMKTFPMDPIVAISIQYHWPATPSHHVFSAIKP